MLSVFLLVFSAHSFAKGPIGQFLDEATGLRSPRFELGYAQKEIQRVQTNYENKAYDEAEKRLNAELPIQSWTVKAQTKLKEIQSQARIPGTNRTLPSSLWDGRFSTNFKYEWAGVSGVGVNLTLGSASDEPLHSLDNSFYQGTAYLSVGVEPRTALIFFLNLSDLRPIFNDIPIPGFSYGFRLSPYWGISLGFPHFGLWIEPADWLRFRLSAEPLNHVDGRLTLDLGAAYQLYVGALVNQEIYKRSGRKLKDEYLFFDQTQINAGLIQSFGFFIIEATAGFDLERRIHETNQYIKDQKKGFLSLAKGWIGQLQARLEF